MAQNAPHSWALQLVCVQRAARAVSCLHLPSGALRHHVRDEMRNRALHLPHTCTPRTHLAVAHSLSFYLPYRLSERLDNAITPVITVLYMRTTNKRTLRICVACGARHSAPLYGERRLRRALSTPALRCTAPAHAARTAGRPPRPRYIWRLFGTLSTRFEPEDISTGYEPGRNDIPAGTGDATTSPCRYRHLHRLFCCLANAVRCCSISVCSAVTDSSLRGRIC